MQELKTLIEKAKLFFTGRKHTGLLLAAGLAGIALIFLSEAFADKTSPVPQAGEDESAGYVRDLEEKLTQMCRKIEGTGEVLVTVTLENGKESVFASDVTESEQMREEIQGGETTRETAREREEAILHTGSGGAGALLRTYREPKVSGVVVVCEGGGDTVVRTKVTMAVSTVLGVSSNRVYVTR